MLVTMNNNATTEVNLVKKLPAPLEDISESLPPPIPRAPPSDFCNNTDPINKIASNTKDGLNSENLSLLCDPLKFDNCYFGLARFDSDKTTNESDLIIL